ncbi:MAG: hypothetical protein Q4C85_07455 [Actinomyces sp.]|uniref:hypothetical protein n=1 Tax=Actinomyces sp. TaxID=29317 RepID=UPI0026DB939F|nr:hypothetical protein [Actinomyces sp.]MDO4243580.1 hypothetical protein [Actinomyces sp.]
MSPDPAAPAPGSPEDLEARLAPLRAALHADVEELGSRLAPARLPALARSTARSALAAACGRARSRGAELAQRAGIGTGTEGSSRSAASEGVSADLSAASLRTRLTRLLDDARDGDPASLAIVSTLALALAGLSAAALVKAVRR